MRQFWIWIWVALLAAYLLGGCASLATEDRVAALENISMDMRSQEIRLTLLEEKVRDLEGTVALLGPSGSGPQPAAVPRPIAPPPPRAAVQAESVASDIQPQASPARAGGPMSREKAAYDAALATYEAHKYAEAEAAFTAFMQAYPSSSLMPNAWYWLGECRYGLKRYDEAILAFKNGVTRFPTHAKAADCMLKIGYCYDKLGDGDNARFYLEALLEDYPRTRAANLARQRLVRA